MKLAIILGNCLKPCLLQDTLYCCLNVPHDFLLPRLKLNVTLKFCICNFPDINLSYTSSTTLPLTTHTHRSMYLRVWRSPHPEQWAPTAAPPCRPWRRRNSGPAWTGRPDLEAGCCPPPAWTHNPTHTHRWSSDTARICPNWQTATLQYSKLLCKPLMYFNLASTCFFRQQLLFHSFSSQSTCPIILFPLNTDLWIVLA